MEIIAQIITADENRLIRHVAAAMHRSYARTGHSQSLDLEDFIQYGMVGLMEAKRSYRNETGVPWLAFAAIRVKGAMRDSWRRESIIRLPQEVQQKIKQVKAVKKDYFSQHGRLPNTAQIAAELALPAREITALLASQPSFVEASTLDMTECDEQPATPAAIIKDHRDSPDEQAAKKQLRRIISHCLELLPSARDRIIFLGRQVEELKLRELAESFGCSEENIRQIENKAKKQLRACLESSGVNSADWLREV